VYAENFMKSISPLYWQYGELVNVKIIWYLMVPLGFKEELTCSELQYKLKITNLIKTKSLFVDETL
jgi:hypothetical protein